MWYDITGKQAVDMLAELSDISYEIFIKICEAVVAMAEILDGLLISPDILLLRPESIFFDNQTENVSFCCYFGNEKEIGKSFHELLEYLLAKLDHKNVNGVQTAYELFEYTRMDGYCIAEIKKILRKAEYTEDVPEKITETVWKEEESEYMSIPVENKKKGILRLWQQKEQNIFGRIKILYKVNLPFSGDPRMMPAHCSTRYHTITIQFTSYNIWGMIYRKFTAGAISFIF